MGRIAVHRPSIALQCVNVLETAMWLDRSFDASPCENPVLKRIALAMPMIATGQVSSIWQRLCGSPTKVKG